MNSIKGKAVRELVVALGKALEKERECLQSGPFQSTSSSPDAITGTKRDDVVAWMIEKSNNCGYHPETWALSVTILDRFLRIVKAQPKYLQCIAITCLFIASKFSEEEEVLLTAAELVLKSRCGCSASDIVRMERIIVDKLQWNLRFATPLEFMHIFHALLTSSDTQTFTNTREACALLDTLVAHLRQCAASHKLLGYRPSTLALSVLSLELEQCLPAWLPITMGLQRLASIDNLSLIKCREQLSSCLPPLSGPVLAVYAQLSRPVKRKIRTESESSIPGDEEMYEGVKRLYGPDDDNLLPGTCAKIGCGAEAMPSAILAHDMPTTVAI